MATDNLNTTYIQSDENNTSNLDIILAGFDGTVAMIGTVGCKRISATSNIVNGVISETIECGDSEMFNEDLEKAFVFLIENELYIFENYSEVSLIEYYVDVDVEYIYDSTQQTIAKNIQESIIPVLKDIGIKNISLDNQTYQIKQGDTLYDIAQENNTTVENLIIENPWLESENRISEDGNYVLIKPDEILNLVSNNNQTVDTTQIDNSFLDLNIHTNDPLYQYSGGLLIGDSDWEAVMPDSILNGDGWLNTEMSRIASDNFRPGAVENVDLNITNGLDFRLENIDLLIDDLDSNTTIRSKAA